jgi:hypothetical protein
MIASGMRRADPHNEQVRAIDFIIGNPPSMCVLGSTGSRQARPSAFHLSPLAHETHCFTHSPVTWPLITFRRFQALMAAIATINAPNASSS